MASSHRVLAVRTVTEQYDIHIGQGILTHLGAQLAALLPGRKVLLFSHPHLLDLYGSTVTASLHGAGLTVETCPVPEGERSKSLEMASQLYTQMAQGGADRHSIVCALGGGVIGDLSGFVAATYMRGVPFVQIPTSLLAMVDSSIGGKTGVNHALGKNLIGAFYPPRAVFTDITLLRSLPEREYLCGLSEIVKAGIIADPELFAFIELHIAEIQQRQEQALITLIERAIAVKVQVVQEDPTERSLRAILNFGHTLGHALEAVTAYEHYSHGEAVAIGMALVAQLSVQLGYCTSETAERLQTVLRALHLPVTYTGITPQPLLETMAHDKKSLNGVVRFVMLQDIGKVAYHQEVPFDSLYTLLAQHTAF